MLDTLLLVFCPAFQPRKLFFDIPFFSKVIRQRLLMIARAQERLGVEALVFAQVIKTVRLGPPHASSSIHHRPVGSLVRPSMRSWEQFSQDRLRLLEDQVVLQSPILASDFPVPCSHENGSRSEGESLTSVTQKLIPGPRLLPDSTSPA